MKKSALIHAFCMCISFAVAQQPLKPNEFKIGMFTANFATHMDAGCDVPYTTPLDANNNKTSTLNVLSEDGFNIWQTYEPNEWNTEEALRKKILLTAANNMKIEVGAGHYYKPNLDINGNYIGSGTNVYDNCGNSIPACQYPYSLNYFRGHINNFINNIYKIAPYKDIIWGYHICEEASYYHPMQTSSNCVGNVWGDPAYFKNVEIPPTNVNLAISYFKTSLANSAITNHKMVVMEANHHRSILSNTVDHEGIYNPQNYLQLLNKNDKRDVFFDGSYGQFSHDGWLTENYSDITNSGPNNNWHYLGKFKSIEYEKTIANQVHSVIASYVWDWPYNDLSNYHNPATKSGLIYHYHSNPSIPNANWLWFQAYTSIIHGAEGVWFWEFNAWSPNDAANRAYMANTANANRFEKQYFPDFYKNYAGYLAKELRYLVNNNIISTDPNTIVATKTDSPDLNCVLPAASTYLASLSLPAEKKTENYGLRYTIRTNGSETYMIISNPLNVAVSTTLSFSNIANPVVQSSIGVNVLFDNNAYAVTSSNYKTNRNSYINLNSNLAGNNYNIAYTGNKQLLLSMGPLDVKVLKFVSTPPDYNNGWTLSWSNYGNGTINGHSVSDNDLFYPGDFDGDGTDELLCVQYNSGSNSDWITMLKYINNNWEWNWSNYGSSSATAIYSYRNNFTVGDFNGDEKDELLGNIINGQTTMFRFNAGTWQNIWTTSINSGHAILPYKDKFYAGDFNGDGKDEVFGCDLPNGWTTSFKWNGSNFIWDWSDNGTHAIRPYRTNLLAGDFDADGKTEMLGLSSWATLFHFDAGQWNWGWSTNGGTSFAGWSYPLLATDKILSGNIDSDAKDELFFIQRHSSADWATTMDLKASQLDWNWNWTANSQYSIPFIDNWSINPGTGLNTNYYLLKPKLGENKHLLAMRKWCNKYVVNMYKINGAGNYKTEQQITSSISDGTITVFPNPSGGKFNINASGKEITNVKAYNITGELVFESKYNNSSSLELNISDLNPGIYILKIFDAAQNPTFVKIHLIK